MFTMTQEQLQTIWHKYADRLDNDADSDVVRADFHEELGRLGGIPIHGRGGLDSAEADALVTTLQKKGCAVLHDPSSEGEDAALLLFLPEEVAREDNAVGHWPCVAGSPSKDRATRALSSCELMS